MTFKISEDQQTATLNGIKLIAVDWNWETNNCEECALFKTCEGAHNCSPASRKDGRDICWIKEEEKSFEEKLHELCGYAEDGSCSTVKIFQDDATKTWHCYVDARRFFANSFTEVMQQAFKYYEIK